MGDKDIILDQMRQGNKRALKRMRQSIEKLPAPVSSAQPVFLAIVDGQEQAMFNQEMIWEHLLTIIPNGRPQEQPAPRGTIRIRKFRLGPMSWENFGVKDIVILVVAIGVVFAAVNSWMANRKAGIVYNAMEISSKVADE